MAVVTKNHPEGPIRVQVTKLDPDGESRWTRHVDMSNLEGSEGVATDASSRVFRGGEYVRSGHFSTGLGKMSSFASTMPTGF